MPVKSQFLEKLQTRQSAPASSVSKTQADIAEFCLRMAQLQEQMDAWLEGTSTFGEDAFKIGMNRRLEPVERVKELSGAAVPFDFDVHAMLSCDDAPALEKTLHDHLESYQINRVNQRKDFFPGRAQQNYR